MYATSHKPRRLEAEASVQCTCMAAGLVVPSHQINFRVSLHFNVICIGAFKNVQVVLYQSPFAKQSREYATTWLIYSFLS